MTRTPRSIAGSIVRRGMRIGRRLGSLLVSSVIGTITNVTTQEAVVALTFDDGPHPEYTPRLLELLEKHHAKATFFLVGDSAKRYPELVERIAKAGHSIGNHSWDHPSFPLISGRDRRWQLHACEEAIAPYGQKLFRPPFGHQTIASRIDALLYGYKVIAWNVVGVDWLDHDADRIVDRILSRISPGSIILLHDALYVTEQADYASREATLEAVDLLLERERNNYRFVTVPKLLECGRPEKEILLQNADKGWLSDLEKVDE